MVKNHTKKKHHSFRNNPPRGNPGILAVCETGRESKCLREALEIVRHYFYASNNDSVKAEYNGMDHAKSQLSLEDEIAMLKKGASADAVLSGSANPAEKHDAPFRVYDTGCRGTVFIMCTLPNSELIKTTISTAKSLHNKIHADTYKNAQEDDCERSEVNQSSCLGTKRKHKENKDISKRKKIEDRCTKWDPINAVQSIMNDIRAQKNDAPRSRFCTRMVPIQVTCFASLEEIKANAKELIQDFLIPKAKERSSGQLSSFKIEFKRRNCNHIRREQIVDAIANIVGSLSEHAKKGNGAVEDRPKPLFRVDLDNPDYTIIIELCRTLCGMSIVANANSYKRFNLIVLQEESTAVKTQT